MTSSLARRVLLAAVLVGLAAPAAPSRADDTSPIGNNVGGFLTRFSPELVFVDAFRSAGDWNNGLQKFDVDQDGWIRSLKAGQTAESGVFSKQLKDLYPSGDYVVLWEGDGDLELVGAATGVKSKADNRMVVGVDASKGYLGLRITRVNPARHVRNIRVIMPGHEQTYRQKPFYPSFLESLRPYSVQRFLHWLHIDSKWISEPVRWSDRTLPTHFTQATPRGVAYEHMIDLANTLHQHPWFTLPQGATDDYVRGLAKLLQSRLDPTLKAHIELSNEVWNQTGAYFYSHQAAIKAGCAAGLNKLGDYPDDNPKVAPCTRGNVKLYTAHKWQAKRSAEVFEIFDEVFGPKQRARYVKVLGSASINPEATRVMLNALHDPKINPIGVPIDAVAIAPYFGGVLGFPSYSPETRSMTVDQLLDALAKDVKAQEAQIAKTAELTRARGVRLIAYEGGHHLLTDAEDWGADGEKVLANFRAAANHARMESILTDYFERWRAAGGELFAHFKNVEGMPPGSCGILDKLNQDPAKFMSYARYRAIVKFAKSDPVWWNWDGGSPRKGGRAAARTRAPAN